MQRLEHTEGKIDLLICCGDFQVHPGPKTPGCNMLNKRASLGDVQVVLIFEPALQSSSPLFLTAADTSNTSFYSQMK